jgi:hypothetical protein
VATVKAQLLLSGQRPLLKISIGDAISLAIHEK